MIRLHHLNNSRSQRIIWLLEELKVEYVVQQYERDKVTNLAPNQLKKVHPLGKSPVLSHNDQVIAESGAIIDYLTHEFPNALVPSDKQDLMQARFWLHYAEGSLMPLLIINLILNKIEQNAKPFFIKAIAKKITQRVKDNYLDPNIENHFAFIEQHLQTNSWFAGDNMSIADIQMIFPLETSCLRIPYLQQCPAIQAYVKKVHALPGYQKALEVGGDYDFA